MSSFALKTQNKAQALNDFKTLTGFGEIRRPGFDKVTLITINVFREYWGGGLSLTVDSLILQGMFTKHWKGQRVKQTHI